jgi:hypothetical protein
MGDAIRLNLGCGYRKIAGCVNIDNRPEVNPDLLLDVTNGFPYKDNSVAYILAIDFLEHIPIGSVIPFIEEVYRILMMGGVFHSVTPSTDGRGAFQDPTHVSFWNINSWMYYMDDLYRNLYGIKAKFEGTLEDTQPDPNYVIHTQAILRKVDNGLNYNTAV